MGKLSKFASLTIGTTGHAFDFKRWQRYFRSFTRFSDPRLCMPVGEKVKIFNFKGDIKNFLIILF